MSFRSLYRHGFARVAACTVRVALADPAANAEAILHAARACHDRGTALVVFPELALSAYAIDDLRLADTLLDAVEAAAGTILEASRELLPLLLIGAPLRHQGRVYNTALAIHRGRLLGVVPKTYLPNYREFYEPRQFASGDGWAGGEIRFAGQTVPFGPDLLFACADLPDLIVQAEICEDFWIPVPPSSLAALAGATVLANLSGSPITIGKADTRRLLCQSQSVRCLSAYLYAAAGAGESTTDVAWDGQATIFENGTKLAETERFPDGERIALADIDLDLLRQERMRMGSFDDNRRTHAAATRAFRRIGFTLAPPADDLGLLRRWNVSPSCRPIRRGWNRIATKPTTSRWRDSRSGWTRRISGARSSASPAGSIPPRRCWSPRAPSTGWDGRARTSSPIQCPASPPAQAPRPTRSR